MNNDTLLEKAINHKAMIDAYRKDIANNKYMIEQKGKELKDLNSLYQTTQFSYEYLNKLVKEESSKFIKKLNDVLDYGVKTIFDDCNYSIEIRVSDNNKATIHLVYDDENGNKIDPIIQNVGGGIRTVVGLLMQIFFIFHYKTEPIIFCDESLSQISSAYLPNTFSLIDELAKKNGLKILLITHDERFIKYADKRYMIADGRAVEVATEKSLY